MEEIPMKRTISLILALILFCTLPGMFASDEFDLIDEEEISEEYISYPGIDDGSTHSAYCSYCGCNTSCEYCIDYLVSTFTPTDHLTHWSTIYYNEVCTYCSNRWGCYFYGEFQETHWFDINDACIYCGY